MYLYAFIGSSIDHLSPSHHLCLCHSLQAVYLWQYNHVVGNFQLPTPPSAHSDRRYGAFQHFCLCWMVSHNSSSANAHHSGVEGALPLGFIPNCPPRTFTYNCRNQGVNVLGSVGLHKGHQNCFPQSLAGMIDSTETLFTSDSLSSASFEHNTGTLCCNMASGQPCNVSGYPIPMEPTFGSGGKSTASPSEAINKFARDNGLNRYGRE